MDPLQSSDHILGLFLSIKQIETMFGSWYWTVLHSTVQRVRQAEAGRAGSWAGAGRAEQAGQADGKYMLFWAWATTGKEWSALLTKRCSR